MSLKSASGNEIVPKITTDEAVKWVESGGSFLSSFIDSVLILIMAIGFLVFVAGIIRLMKSQREEAGMSAGGSRPETVSSLWMIIGGGLLGSLTAIYYAATRLMSI